MLEDLDLHSIADERARELVRQLLNLLEDVMTDLRVAHAENQRLRDAINRLKGEQGRPMITSNQPQPPRTAHSSEQERRKPKGRSQGRKRDRIAIDREPVVQVAPDCLPGHSPPENGSATLFSPMCWASGCRFDRGGQHCGHRHLILVTATKATDDLTDSGLDRFSRCGLCPRKVAAARTLPCKVASKTCSGVATCHTCGTEVIDGAENPAAWSTRWLCVGSLNKKKFGPTGSPTSSVPWVRLTAHGRLQTG